MEAMTSLDIGASEFEARRERAREAADAAGLDALVAWSRGGTSVDFYGDVMYLSNHHALLPSLPDTTQWHGLGHAAVVLTSAAGGVLVTTTLDEPEDRLRIDQVVQTVDLPATVAEILKAQGAAGGRIGISGRESITHASWARLEAELDPGAALEEADHILNRLRFVKSDAEVDLMRRAGRVGCGWMRTMMESVRAGVTEADVVADGLAYLVRNNGYPYDVAIAAGPRVHHYWGSSGIPHWNGEEPLRSGDLVHCDAWGAVDGYYTDFARSRVVDSDPTPEQLSLLEAAIAHIDHILGVVKPGATIHDLWQAGSEWLVDNGFDTSTADGSGFRDMFPAFGHSIGLGDENPQIIEGDETELRPNATIAVETVLDQPGTGAANHEENILVTQDGYELLTAECPPRWW